MAFQEIQSGALEGSGVESEASEVAERPKRAKRPRLASVLVTEDVLKRALVPLATQARERGIELLCELGYGVGEFLVGDERPLAHAVIRGVRRAMNLPRVREVRVRVVRQRAGFVEGPAVLATVIADDGARHVSHAELSLPASPREHDSVEAIASGSRVLLVVPRGEGTRIVTASVRGFGGAPFAVGDANAAREQLERARGAGAEAYDAVYVDDAVADSLELVRSLSDEVLRAPPIVVATAFDGPGRQRFGQAGAKVVLPKPVLPRELAAAVARALGLEPADAGAGGESPAEAVVPHAPRASAPSRPSPRRTAAPVIAAASRGAPAPHAQVLDLAVLFARTRSDVALAKEILSDFLRYSDVWMRALAEATEADRYEEIVTLGHRFGRALLALGARGAGRAAGQVVRWARLVAGAEKAEPAVAREGKGALVAALVELEGQVGGLREAARAYLGVGGGDASPGPAAP